jgi:hypothetical protein
MLFKTAEGLGKTVDEVLTGKRGPMSTTEHRYWLAYLVVKRELEQGATDDATNVSSQDSDNGENRFVTMGQKNQ